MTTVDVLIPFESLDEHRMRAHQHVLRWWHAHARETGVTGVGSCTAQPYTKGGAVLHAAIASEADLVIMADADCLPEPGYIAAAIRAVERGSAWVIPHTNVVRLTQPGSHEVIRQGLDPAAAEVSYTHRGMAGGGCVVLRRETLLACPIDPRFNGWGNEDESWAWALSTLAGRALRLQGTLYHLWHPRAPRLDPFRGSLESKALSDRYRAAYRNPLKMRALVDEFRLGYGL